MHHPHTRARGVMSRLLATSVVVVALLAYVVKLGHWPQAQVADGNTQRNLRWGNDFSGDATSVSGAPIFYCSQYGHNLHVRRFLPVNTPPCGTVYVLHGWAGDALPFHSRSNKHRAHGQTHVDDSIVG